MAYLEITKNGKTVRRERVPDERAKAGFTVRLSGHEPIRMKLGETTRAGDYELRVIADATDPDDSTDSAAPSSPGKRVPHLDGYELDKRLGEGGMGVVWKGVQQSTHRTVAVKFLGRRAFGSDRSRKRFEREVHLSAKLEHPAIVRVYDSGLVHGVYFYAMELIDGQSLDQYAEQNKLTRNAILQLFKTLCDAVQYAHDRGVIHRDLKPSNVLVTKDGQPHVLDFGLAKSLIDEAEETNHHLTMSLEGEAAGTPAYMSPEQAAGRHAQTDGRTDVWSIGVMLYRLLVGHPPHDLSGTRFDVTKRIVEEEIRSPRSLGVSINADLEGLLRKAIARQPEDRYSTVGELGQDIENFLKGHPLIARKATFLYRLQKHLARRKALVAGCAAAVAIAILLCIGVLPGGWIRARLTQTRTVSISQPPTIQRVYLPATQSTVPLSVSPVASTAVVATREVLFDGTDLSKWFVRHDGSPAPGIVHDGYVIMGGTADIVTINKYTDFKLHLEFWCPRTGNTAAQPPADSGVLLQGRYEIQILDSYGVVVPNVEDCGAISRQKAPTVNACRPPEQWQSFDITFHAAQFDADGHRAAKAVVTVVQNGQLIHDNVELTGSTFQANPESPSPGPIRLRDRGDTVRFRNILIESIPQPAAPADAATQSVPPTTAPISAVAAAPVGTREVLFDGTDLSKWLPRHGDSIQWVIRDGYVEAEKNGDIFTKEKYKDFKLHVEFWCPPGHDSPSQRREHHGVFLQSRYEIQITDSSGVAKPDPGDCGAVYGQTAPSVNACNPPEQWQTYDITFHSARFDSDGHRLNKATVTVVQNGQTVQDNVAIDDVTLNGDREDASPGPIRLQGRGLPFRFRNIWIEPIQDPAASPGVSHSGHPG